MKPLNAVPMTTPTRCAVYARKSTEQIVSAEMKSVARQVDNAKRFAATKGWSVEESCVFIDDAISGAEFERRPGLQAMLKAAMAGQFTVLIVSEQKTLGREMIEVAHLVKRLAQAGCEVYEYVHGKSLTPRRAIEKLLATVQGFSDEDMREKTAERVHEAHLRLATAGRVTGGRVYGYRNVHRFNGVDASGNPLKSHTERVIEPAEGAIVHRIFDLYASGIGLKSIAKTLTREQAAVPTPFIRKDPTKTQPQRAWAPSSVRSILCRDLYRAVVTWNRSKKRDEWGQKRQHARPVSEWQSVAVPSLRIVSDDLWQRCAARRADTAGKCLRFADGRLVGRPPKSGTTHLLSGLATCSECGGGLVVETSPRSRGRVPEYLCHRRRATGACKNRLHMACSIVDEAILRAVEEVALVPGVVESIVQLSERDDAADRLAALSRDRADVQKRIEKLITIIEGSDGDLVSLTARLRQLEAQRRDLDTQLANVQPLPRLPRPVIEDRLSEWRRLLRQSTTQARAVLQRLIKGRITFTPHGDSYAFEAETRVDKLFSGVALSDAVWTKRGRGTSRIRREDVEGAQPAVDADYAAVLARAIGRLAQRADSPNVKRVTSPTGFEPVFWP